MSTSMFETSSSSTTPPGHLVWCHERCQKKDSEVLLGQFQGLARELGYAFHTFKKAPTYESWIARACPNKHILITDNRELKPCLTFLSEAVHSPCPNLVIVFVTEGRLLDRVRRVVRALKTKHNPRNMTFTVCSSFESVIDSIRHSPADDEFELGDVPLFLMDSESDIPLPSFGDKGSTASSGSRAFQQELPGSMGTTVQDYCNLRFNTVPTPMPALDPEEVIPIPFFESNDHRFSTGDFKRSSRYSDPPEAEAFPCYLDIFHQRWRT
mmetsp:Transcript_87675/g.183299  ORF Transcript_87675/g.183299 Transcript_87675/m.183299 type:complete len:268 (-) Transcript_87675:199-1002(-)